MMTTRTARNASTNNLHRTNGITLHRDGSFASGLGTPLAWACYARGIDVPASSRLLPYRDRTAFSICWVASA